MSGKIIFMLLQLIRKYPLEIVGVIAVTFFLIPLLIITIGISVAFLPMNLFSEKDIITPMATKYEIETEKASVYIDLVTKKQMPESNIEIANYLDDFIETVDIKIDYIKEVEIEVEIEKESPKIKSTRTVKKNEDRTYEKTIKEKDIEKITIEYIRNESSLVFREYIAHYIKENITNYISDYKEIISIDININFANFKSLINDLYPIYEELMNEEMFIAYVETQCLFIGTYDVEGKDVSFPTPGVVTSPYGYRVDPINGNMDFHSGIDIANVKDTEIYAALDGEIIHAAYDEKNGNMVKIKHSKGLITKYLHTNKMLVKVGQKVKKGDLIALMGTTGRSTGVHLHFMITDDGKIINPNIYVEFQKESKQ